MSRYDNDAGTDQQRYAEARRLVLRWNGEQATAAAMAAKIRDAGTAGDVEARPASGWLAVYEIDRAYGGPEEGGWCYDTGRLVACVPADRWTMADYSQAKGRMVEVRPLYESDAADGDSLGRIPLADDRAAEAMVAACLARYGLAAFLRDASSVTYDGGALALEWRDDTPEAYYPATRPRYE